MWKQKRHIRQATRKLEIQANGKIQSKFEAVRNQNTEAHDVLLESLLLLMDARVSDDAQDSQTIKGLQEQ